MIIFQATPCRLYPKIIQLIQEQFRSSTYVHEIFALRKGIKDNPLQISQNNLIFKRNFFLCGIFQTHKVDKKSGDFWFGIKIPQNKLFEEFYCAVQYFGSLNYLKTNPNSEYIRHVYRLYRPLTKFTKDEFVHLCENGQIKDVFQSDFYELNEELQPNHDKFDYLGDFDNWDKTIIELQNAINLDLSSLKHENPYSFN